MLKNANFVLSCAKKEQFPDTTLPEVAFVGRSNVGKSSLINHLTNKKGLAHVSGTPGKTQLVNFFNVDDLFTLVDLPGYGFAKISKSKREKWGDLLQDYLEERENLKLIILLLDIRHLPSKEDIAFANWAMHFKKPLMIVFTKSDKLSKHKLPQELKQRCSYFLEQTNKETIDYLAYSVKDPKARIHLTKEIGNKLDTH